MTVQRPFADFDLLLIDGNNYLQRTAGGADRADVQRLVGELQAVAPAHLQTIVMLDGHGPVGGTVRQRRSAALEVRHAGPRTADDALVELATAQQFAGRARTLVVTDDISLKDRVRATGARTQRLSWLQEILSPAAKRAVSIGRRLPRSAAADPAAGEEQEHEPWKPGRRATEKLGNPCRKPRRARPRAG